MIEKLKTPKSINWDDTPEGLIERHRLITDAYEKINELVDAVNVLMEENNIHEKQIDELQMKLEPEKCEPAENVQDKFAEQRKWLHKLCWFWDDGCADYIGILYGIHDLDEIPFENDLGAQFQHCRLVKPDDDIIYKGGKDE